MVYSLGLRDDLLFSSSPPPPHPPQESSLKTLEGFLFEGLAVGPLEVLFRVVAESFTPAA